MGLHKIKKGLDLPIKGKPEQSVSDGPEVKRVALLGTDYVGLKPKFEVRLGDTVKTGQTLFSDKKIDSVKFTSPGSGKIVEINRGEKRAFLSIVIELDSNEDQMSFETTAVDKLKSLDRKSVVSRLLESGLWTALRARPFGKVADPATVPNSLFITAMDSDPIAPGLEAILQGKENDFENGLTVLSKLTEGKVYVCKYPESKLNIPASDQISVEDFSGPHPAGLPGTHIHFLDPVGHQKSAWHIGLQDVIAVGKLFTSGSIDVERIVALGGPAAKNPRLVRTRMGASVDNLLAGELSTEKIRPVSGSVFSGHAANGASAYLGRYHQQVVALPTDEVRRFFGWLSLGSDLFSIKPILLSSILPKKNFAFSTNLHGGKRSIVPIGMYEKVMPLDVLPTFLLRAIAVDDIEDSENFGALELVEEDLSLCTFVCPSKLDHGANLRRVLNIIEKEG